VTQNKKWMRKKAKMIKEKNGRMAEFLRRMAECYR
jgi:hypothetical protein